MADPVTAPIPDAIDATLPPSKALVPKASLLIRFGKWIQPKTNRWISRSSRVPDVPVYDAADFAWTRTLEDNWEIIRDEAAAVLQDLEEVPPLATISPDHRRIAPAGRWRSFFLVGYRYRDEANCRACPRTAELISKVPGLNSAFFSILVPGTHLPAHTGVSKAFLTCHLGIQVPHESAKCRMRVVDEWLEWREGKCLVFDDVYNHEVVNDSDETRIVLLVQFKRPVGPVGWIIGNLFLEGVRRSRFVQDARAGVERWRNRKRD
ncbi:aspartyl/asparaginyl beta-hydroxylase domain-containing protein [Novosphingobium sp.]|uniref:aspartyl/asparaginyl beta-hydroxylase domain-containing protein n=1 Tax=Novosphingobium sp. TaxID=1874826 RepID=UPI002B48ACAA|nr:aspartyl/asparaginyl beta-hydroxylase domain-containing protein [Novosphingobium sp.]HKR91843.1 aspartyl/asparaginyl beta-hydroxylase domain-containing protein [Novosphingobium sp.]